MIQRLLQKAISDLETNYVDKHGNRLIVRHKYKSSSDKWYKVYLAEYITYSGNHYTEIGYYYDLIFLYHYYFSSRKNIFNKSTHPELLI